MFYSYLQISNILRILLVHLNNIYSYMLLYTSMMPTNNEGFKYILYSLHDVRHLRGFKHKTRSVFVQ
jgi:hypothetical protein